MMDYEWFMRQSSPDKGGVSAGIERRGSFYDGL